MPDGVFTTCSGAEDGDDTGVFLRSFDAYGTRHETESRLDTATSGAKRSRRSWSYETASS
jgi:hypothetical protein